MVVKNNISRRVESNGQWVALRSYAWTRHVRCPTLLNSFGSDELYRVKNKMEKGDGMSFSEFCYPLMQAWDWWQLYKSGTQVQIGGADQFGNILAGAEAVKYMIKNDPNWQQELSVTARQGRNTGKHDPVASSDPMGFTVPLLTTAAGEKFGKSAGNAIWLDREMTSSFDLYQVKLMPLDCRCELTSSSSS
jgi:tyrosyl-tRNA synthetase